MAGGVSVDGFDLADLGVTVLSDGLDGWRDSVDRHHRSQRLPAGIGEARTSVARAAGARLVNVRARQTASDVATLLSRRDELLWRLDKDGEMNVRFDDESNRHLRCRLAQEGVDVSPIAPVLSQVQHDLRIPFVAEDPRWWADSQDSVTGIGSTAQTIPLGTAPVGPSIEASDASFTIIYRDSSGTEVARLEVSGASSTPVTVDMAAQTITSSNGSELANRVSGTGFFLLDPQDGDYPSSTWPTLEVTSGTIDVTYRKAWH